MALRVASTVLGASEVNVHFGAESTGGREVRIPAPSAVVEIPIGAAGAACWHGVLRRAKDALLRMTAFVWTCSQFDDGTLPYFCSQISSSRTFILPCQGFLLRLWPSPGKISRAFGMPSE